MQTELLTIKQFCEAINCGRTYAYQLLNNGKVAGVKNGRKTLIPREEMLRWKESLQPYKQESEAANG